MRTQRVHGRFNMYRSTPTKDYFVANFPFKPWRNRSLRWLGIFIASLLLLALISWLVLPSYLKRLATEQIQAQLGRKLQIGEIRFAPHTLTLTASDLTLYEADQVTPALTARALVINASAASLLRRALVLDQARLIAPSLHLVRTSSEAYGHYNFTDIIERIAAMPKSESPLLFSLANLQLENGTIHFDDKVLGKRINIDSLNIALPFVSNLSSAKEDFILPSLSGKMNGSPFALKGRSKPFTGSQETSLALDFEQLDVASYAGFSPVPLPVTIQSAKLSTKLDLGFVRSKGQPELRLSGDVRVADLALNDKSATPLLRAAAIRASIKQFNPLTGAAAIEKISIDTPEIWANLNNKGALNWASLTPTKAAAPPASEKPAMPAMTLAELSLQNGIVHWADAANATPQQNVKLERIAVNLKQLSSAPDAKPAELTFSASGEHGEALGFVGQFQPNHTMLTGQAALSAIPLAQYQGYANRTLAADIAGQFELKSTVLAQDGQIRLSDLGININDFKLQAKSKADGGITAKNIALEHASVDTGTRIVSADALLLNNLRGDLKRDAQGKLNLQKFLLPDVSAKPAAQAKNAPGWKTGLKTLTISDSAISFEDKAVTPAVALRADAIKLTLGELSNDMSHPIAISLQSKINGSGKLALSGNATPSAINLALDSQNLPIAALQPYFADDLNVTLSSGQASAKGKLTVHPASGKLALQSSYNGTLKLSDFRILNKGTSNDFLKWKSIDVDGINASIGGAQPRITLKKLALNDFYARAILSDKGKLNLQDILVSNGSTSAASPQPDTAPKLPAYPASHSASSTAAAKTAATDKAPVIRINQIVMRGGNINFTDNFIKPNYSANLTGLGGSIGAIASDNPQPASIELQGKIDSDAPVLISGTLNPLFKPMFLDIKASANGLELTRLTPYAAKYAGYAIEKGKMSMRVAYRVENQQLTAQNDLRLDQLTFGERIDSPDATKLPVLLAVALLKDNNGEIAVNLPISGSLSDPQFSMGGIIFRVFMNLIVKAVSAPFSLLGAAFGGGEELGYAEFPPGLATLTPAIQTKLDTLAKALKNRSGLKLDIIARVDPKTDSEGLRQDQLNAKIKAHKLKELLRQGKSSEAEQLTLSDADKSHYLGSVYKDEKFPKPRNMIGLAKSLPPEEMEKLILANTTITPEALHALAQQRADAVRDYLEQKGEISNERLFLIAPKLNAEGIKDQGLPSRVDFSLK